MSWILGPGVRWLQVDDGATVFVPNAAQFVELDLAGAELLVLLDSAQWQLAEAVQKLSDAHGLSLDDARRALCAFAGELEGHGVVVRA